MGCIPTEVQLGGRDVDVLCPPPGGNHGEKHLGNGISVALGRIVLGAAVIQRCVPLCRSRRSQAGGGSVPQGPGCVWRLISELTQQK